MVGGPYRSGKLTPLRFVHSMIFHVQNFWMLETVFLFNNLYSTFCHSICKKLFSICPTTKRVLLKPQPLKHRLQRKTFSRFTQYSSLPCLTRDRHFDNCASEEDTYEKDSGGWQNKQEKNNSKEYKKAASDVLDNNKAKEEENVSVDTI